VRLWGVFDAGFPDDDMTYYTIFAEYYRGLIFDHAPAYFGFDIAYKPGFMLLALLSVIAFGYHDYTLLITNAMLSVGVGFATYKIARLCTRSSGAALVAATVVTFLPPLVVVDRRGLTHTGATLVVLVAIYFMLRFVRTRVNGEPKLLYLSGLFLGLAFLFHPTILLYVVALTAVAFYRVVVRAQDPARRKLDLLARYGIAAAAPLLAADIVYRAVMLLWPPLATGHMIVLFGRPVGAGYFGDIARGFLSATVSGEGTRSSRFFSDALHLFRSDPVGNLSIAVILAATALLLFCAWRRRRDFIPIVLFIAYLPPLMMAYNPFVGQLSRALHATYPMLAVVVLMAATELARLLPVRRPVSTAGAVALSAVTALAVIGTAYWGVQDFLDRHRRVVSGSDYLTNEVRLPRYILEALKGQGFKGVYVYYSGFYGMHWFYYMQRYFGAVPFLIQNSIAGHTPDVRIVNMAELKERLKERRVEIVIMRRMRESILHLWGGRKREDEFVAFAELSGAKRIAELGPYRPLPEHVYVYDFRGVQAQ
jgi:4-amino-4-deoxy-L-arabinose transferase-like glycosyltransferase